MPTLSRTLVAVSISTIRKAQHQIAACQDCAPASEVRFSSILARIAERPGMNDYLMSEPADCPRCGRPILEHTRVEPR